RDYVSLEEDKKITAQNSYLKNFGQLFLFIINNIFIYIITMVELYFLFSVKNDLIYALYVYFSFFRK
ncbi:MAG: hypothetical protein E6528_07570, partial [Staphylococcus sp.]|nr:hypothetical protein [Staphylococcus sp.]